MKRRQCRIHSYQNRCLEARRIKRIDWLAEAKRHDYVYGHAAESIVEVCALGRFHMPLEPRAEFFRLLYTQTFSGFDSSLRKGTIEHAFSVPRFGVGEVAEAGLILIEAFVQKRILVPAILVVIDIVVSLWIGEVELRK
jgi:hypothetical protein